LLATIANANILSLKKLTNT